MLFAASPMSLERRELGHQLSGEGRYTHPTALRNAACSSSCYVQKARASRARVVVLWVSLGLGGKGFYLLFEEGWEQERGQTKTLIGDTTGEPTGGCAAAPLTAAAVLCPRRCYNLVTPLARSQQEQGGAPVHPTAVGIVIIVATAVLSIALRWRLYEYRYVQRRVCSCAAEMPSSTPRRMYPFRLFAQETEQKNRLGLILHQADISRVRTTYRENIAICDRDIRLDRYFRLVVLFFDSIRSQSGN